MMLTYDIVDGGVVAAGDEVGEKVDHNQAFLLSLEIVNYSRLSNNHPDRNIVQRGKFRGKNIFIRVVTFFKTLS